MRRGIRTLTKIKSKAKKRPNKQKVQFEKYDISKAIALKIINAKVEKVKYFIEGNFVYLIENDSHYEVDAEIDFTGSTDIKSRDALGGEEEELKFKATIEPFLNKKPLVQPRSDPGVKITSVNEGNNNNTEKINDNVDNTSNNTTVYERGKLCEMQYMIGYKLNALMKFAISFPSIEKQRMYINLDNQEVRNALQYCDKQLRNIALDFLIKNNKDLLLQTLNDKEIKPFVDFEYPPGDMNEITIDLEKEKSSNEPTKYDKKNEDSANNIKTVAVHWRLADSIFTEHKKTTILNLDEINPIDIIYGLKKNSRVLSIFAHLSEYPHLITRLFPETTINSFGAYIVRLFAKGIWNDMIIDSYIPCFPFSFPIYTYSQYSLWVVMLEKALSKYYNGYDNLRNARIENLYSQLTGFPVILYAGSQVNPNANSDSYSSLNDTARSYDSIFDKLKEASSQGYLMSAYASPKFIEKNSAKYSKYFLPETVYPILAAIQVDKVRIIILRNIFKESNFIGDFYQNYNLITPNIRQIFDKFAEKTVFFLTPKELVQYFDTIIISQCKSCYDLFFRGKFVRCQDNNDPELEKIISNAYYVVKVNTPTSLKICLRLTDDTFFDEKFISPDLDMSIGILTQERGKWKIVSYNDFTINRIIVEDIKLDIGEYYIIPLTMGYCMKKNSKVNDIHYSAFTPDGKQLNMPLLTKIFEDIFYRNDPFGIGYLSYKTVNDILRNVNKIPLSKAERMNKYEITEDEFWTYVKTYSQNAPGLTMNGFISVMREIFIYLKKDDLIQDSLNNLGYDHNLFPYIDKIFFIGFYSNNPIQVQMKNNLIYDNLDYVINSLLLTQSGQIEKTPSGSNPSDISKISYKSKSGWYYVEGVKNNSRKDTKEVVFDASSCANLYCSTHCLKYNKYIQPGNVDFFMYLVIDNIIESLNVNDLRSTQEDGVGFFSLHDLNKFAHKRAIEASIKQNKSK